MDDFTPRASPDPLRKRLRVGHTSERGAINAVRTLFEGNGLVVDEVDARSDYGRDLIVDVTDGHEITGTVVGVQVKGDRRYIHDGSWKMPVKPKDLCYWSESSVPVFGVLWNPDTGELRWANLTGHARNLPVTRTWPPGRKSRRDHPVDDVLFPESRALTDESLPELMTIMCDYVHHTSNDALLGLFDADVERCVRAVRDCWTLGRGDARALIMLRRALPSLQGEGLRRAIIVLSHLTPHPDILWHAGNWIPPQIEAEVRPHLRWSSEEVCHLVCDVEHTSGWGRGSVGQCLLMVLTRDPGLKETARQAIPLALTRNDLDSAFRLLMLHQYLANDPLEAATAALRDYPGLNVHECARDLLEEIARYGHVDCC